MVKRSRVCVTTLLLEFSFFLILMSGIIVVTNKFRYAQVGILTVGYILLIFEVVFVGNYRISSRVNMIDFLSILNLLSGVLSGIILQDVFLIINIVSLFSIYVLFMFFLAGQRDYKIGDEYRIVSILFIISTIWAIASCPLTMKEYMGYTYNQNSFGGINESFFVYFLAMSIERKNCVLNTVWMLIALFLVTISSSRTSFSVSIVVFLIYLFLKRPKKMKLSKKTMMYVTLGMIFGVIVFTATPMKDVVYVSIIEKFLRKANDPLSKRGGVWLQTWNEKTLFGHGRNYFYNFRWAAHNTFVSILGQYGILTCLSYIVLIIEMLRKSFVFERKNGNMFPLLMCISYIGMSLTEGMLMKINMFFMYYAMAYVVRKNDLEDESTA